MSKEKFTAFRIPSSYDVKFPTNEIHFVFTEESDAADFREWWNKYGSVNFSNYLKRGKEFYKKDLKDIKCRNCGRLGPEQMCDKCRSQDI